VLPCWIEGIGGRLGQACPHKHKQALMAHLLLKIERKVVERLQSTLASLIRLACEPNQAKFVLTSISCNQRDKQQSFP